MEENTRSALQERFAQEPFARKFGIRLVDIDDGCSTVEMTFTPDMENLFGMAHGAALFALMDAAFETACNSHGTLALALNVNVTYMASPAPGARLVAHARELARTHRTASYDIKLYDHDERLLASCQALAYRKGTPLPFVEQAGQ
jgi:acyl-CoA thioesterase